MAKRSHLSASELRSSRPILLTLLRNHRLSGGGFADSKAAKLEVAADAHWFVYPNDEEVVEAWKGFCGQVLKGLEAEGT